MKRIFRPFSKSILLGQKGQVAIFVALIFQVLFLFFAMVINVGLLVHHKINLQNSVDLAAYYGAMKQAQVMNAIAHTNYQIRQSYKLLTWRYRVLGIAGVMPEVDPRNAHPVKKSSNATAVNTGVKGGTVEGSDEDGFPRENSQLKDFYERPSFCVAFRPFKEVPEDENTCRAAEGQTIAALRAAPVVAGFIGAAITARQVTELANRSKRKRCEFVGPYNYTALARFIVAFNIDQGERKKLIYKLANNMSQSTSEFFDIDGERASGAIRMTLDNNLTAANKDSIKEFKIFNSLASGKCGENKGKSSGPPGWLSEINIFPRASYKMCHDDNNASRFATKNIDTRPSESPTSGDPNNKGPEGDLQPDIEYLHNFVVVNNPSSPYRPSLGLEKNPWCMAYVGVRAESEPDIPFSLGKIRLKAYGFAKPFGGRIGPWYGKNWQPGIMESTGQGEQRTDPRTPQRCPFGDLKNCAPQDQDGFSTLNYSRFPGDPVGLMSRRIHAQYGKSIYDLGNMSFDGWKGIEQPTTGRGGEWDILSFGDASEKKMRNLEISAIVPDIFDLTYYSIDPDFYKNYYVGHLDKYLQKNSIDPNFVLHLDLGSRLSGDPLPGGRNSKEFNIKDQIRVAQSLQGTGNNDYSIDWGGKLMYTLIGENNFPQVLTGWIAKPDLLNYDLDEDRFGKCRTPAKADVPSPGSCEKGGRTGYSVKIVSSDYLKDNHKLGGEGSSSAKILNPPDDDFVK